MERRKEGKRQVVKKEGNRGKEGEYETRRGGRKWREGRMVVDSEGGNGGKEWG